MRIDKNSELAVNKTKGKAIVLRVSNYLELPKMILFL